MFCTHLHSIQQALRAFAHISREGNLDATPYMRIPVCILIPPKIMTDTHFCFQQSRVSGMWETTVIQEVSI